MSVKWNVPAGWNVPKQYARNQKNLSLDLELFFLRLAEITKGCQAN